MEKEREEQRALFEGKSKELEDLLAIEDVAQVLKEIAEAGVDMFVAGSAIFNTDDYKATIDAMRAELAEAKI